MHSFCSVKLDHSLRAIGTLDHQPKHVLLSPGQTDIELSINQIFGISLSHAQAERQ